MADITELLERWHGGDRAAFEALIEAVYAELRTIAFSLLRDERLDHTLQPTALVNEAYLRLQGVRELRLENRRHFFGAAAKAMRRVLVDYARQRKAAKRGGPGLQRVGITEALETPVDLHTDFERLDEAIERLAAVAPEKARVVELRYFAGLSVEETAALLECSPATVKRHWTFARAWLFRELDAGSGPAVAPAGEPDGGPSPP
jgi:RNA polymerase sigma factor (TIGR02999 family)